MSFWNAPDSEEQKKRQKLRNADVVGGFFANTAKGLATGVAESIYKPMDVMGKGLGTALAEFTGVNAEIEKNTQKSVDTNNSTIKLLRNRLKTEKDENRKKQIQSSINNLIKSNSDILNSATKTFEEQQKDTDPGHIANNATQLALNIATAGTLTKSIAGGAGAMKSFKLASNAEKVANAAKIAEGAVQTGRIGQVLKAVTNPTSIAEGATAFGTIGAVQGGLSKADEFGASPVDIASAALTSGVMGAGMGAAAGWMGGRVVNARIAEEAARTSNINTNLGKAAAGQITERVGKELDTLEKAKATRAASVVDDVPGTMVVNSVDSNAFNQNITPSGTILPNSVQNAKSATNLGVPNERTPITSLGKAAQSENPALVAQSTPTTITPGTTTTQSLAEKAKNMPAMVTPGKENIIEANITITDDQVKQAVAEMGGIKIKDKVAKLKAIGATDEQMRNTIGVDSNNIKLKPMEIVNQKPSKNPMNDVPPPTGRTAEEISTGAPTDLGVGKLNEGIIDWIDKNAPSAKLTGTQKLNKAIGAGTNTIDRATELLGSFGANVSQKLVKAQHYASNLKTSLRPNIQAFEKQTKKLIGSTQTARQDFGRRLNAALENRALGDKAFTTQAEKDIYNNAVTALDTIKAEMVKHGIQVRDNYTPYQMLKDFGESTDYLSKGLEVAKTKVKSGHALPRKAESMGEMNDQNIIELLPNYVNGMIDHLAFSPVIKQWDEGIGQIPASVRRNTANFNDGINYMNKALGDMVNRSSSSVVDKAVQGLGNAYYRNALYMNPKNAMYSQLQKLQAIADTTHTGRKIANNLSKDTKKLIREKLWFSGYTMSQDAATGMSQAKSELGKAIQKIDINRIGEESAVNQPFQWGFVDSIIKSDAYKAAKKSGLSEDDAIKAAMKNTEVADIAEKAGNMLVNNTMFGANSVARPEILRGKGVLKRAFGMFQRFPMAESQFVKKIFTPKDTRVLEVLASGDPRKVALGESRMAFDTLTTRLKDAEKAIKNGMKIEGAPDLKLLQEQIAISKDAVKKIDKAIKLGSNISSAKRAAAFTSMWIASGAVATMWNGVLNYGNEKYKEKNYWENAIIQDPTLLSKVAPWMPYSVPQSGLTSPLIPFNKYGLNTQGALNLIPGAGVVNRATGNYLGSQLDKIVKGK